MNVVILTKKVYLINIQHNIFQIFLNVIDFSSHMTEWIFIVSRKFVHPKFIDDDIPTISPYDIAILELEISVEMSDTIQPACIANYKNIEIDTRKGTVVTSGWGIVECSTDNDCNTSDILQGTEMFLLSRKLCNMHMKEANVTHLVTEEMICANDHSRVCKFDSGGM